MIGADLDQQHELKHGILSSIFCLLDPDLHLNCGSGSRLQNKCGSMQIRIRIHSPAYTFSKINNKKVEFFNALLTRVAEPEPPGAALFEPEPANHCYRFGLLTTSTGTDLESCAPCFLSVFVSIL